MARERRARRTRDPERERIDRNRAAAEEAFITLRRYNWGRDDESPSAVFLRPIIAEFALVTRVAAPFLGVSGYGAIDPSSRTLLLNPAAPGTADVAAWRHITAHLATHLGLGHHHLAADGALLTAMENQVEHLLAPLGIGQRPASLNAPELPDLDPERLADELRQGLHGPVPALTVAGPGLRDHLPAASTPETDFAARFAEGLQAVLEARVGELGRGRTRESMGEEARRYVVNHHPLLAGMASRISLVTDAVAVDRAGIELAAVDPYLGEIYLSLRGGVTLREAIFLLAHELLHLGLRHADRIGGRDPLIWNLACDLVINGWLVSMGVGVMPQVGGLYDPSAAGRSAEDIYDELAAKRPRRLRTLAGAGIGDIISSGPRVLTRGDVTTLDDIWVSALRRGLDAARLLPHVGTIPAALVEEIEAMGVPPVPWDVALARWFETFVPAAEAVRTYARASRRQSASPDIARPHRHHPERLDRMPTFAVVLDTSGSMGRRELATALGAIASYAQSRGVRHIRLVHCDAAPYDDGYVDIEAFRRRYPVRGRGGTVLGPALALLDVVGDLPPEAPVLVLSDGAWEGELMTRRELGLVIVGAGPVGPMGRPASVFRV